MKAASKADPRLSDIANGEVREKFQSYPAPVRDRLLGIRALIHSVAGDLGKAELHESLKWGQPSFGMSGGSTVRMDWSPGRPDEYGVYFNCNTRLVETFRELYSDKFRFDGKRAIIFGLDDKIPADEFKHCMALSLTYHRVKHMDLLGA